GVSSGGAAVSGSVIVDVLFLTTKAYIGDGARVNQHPERLTGTADDAQTISVTAKDDTSLTNLAGTLALSSSGAGVGIGIDVEVIFKHVQASIAPHSVVSAKGDAGVTATSTEHFFAAAVDIGGSSSSAAVDGSIIVVVFNPTDDLAHAVAAADVSG